MRAPRRFVHAGNKNVRRYRAHSVNSGPLRARSVYRYRMQNGRRQGETGRDDSSYPNNASMTTIKRGRVMRASALSKQ